MENASKALLMAAGVLMGLMIMSLAVYLFASFGGTSGQIHENIEENQLSQFNSQFTSYVGKDNVTIHDVISMANLATQNNQNYEFARRSTGEVTGNDNYIQVLLNGTRIEYGFGDDLVNDVEKEYNKLISEDVSEIVQGNDELKNIMCKLKLVKLLEGYFVLHVQKLNRNVSKKII